DARPDWVQGAQPLEKGAVRSVPAGGPLIHVVVGVHQAGPRDAVGRIDDLVGRRRVPRTHRGDHAVSCKHPAALDLAIAGEHQSGADEERSGHEPTMSCGRTGTRERLRPLAARMAARIAGPDEMVGGSPTPLSPYGAFGSPSSRMSIRTGGMSRVVGRR